MEIQDTLETLGRIAASFPRDSQETKAIETAANALFFARTLEVRNQFQNFVRRLNRPLNGLELIQLRVCGIDIPDEQKTPKIVEFASEIDSLAAKLRNHRPFDI
jgi:hypothetical protein